jgi:putative redox protein
MSESLTEITAAWKGQSTFIGYNAAGGAVQMGSLGDKPGVSPMQLLLVGLAGCTGMDVVSILQKQRVKLTDLQVKVQGERAAEHPKTWSAIRVRYLVWGEAIQPNDVERAIQLSETKYCSVWAMLGKAARMTSDYQILDPGENAELRSEE